MSETRPYWRRAHHDWRFWVGVVLMLAAMFVYVMTENLALHPRPIAAAAVGGQPTLADPRPNETDVSPMRPTR